MKQEHIINATKEFYQKYETGPSMRALLSYLKQSPGFENITSIDIQLLFPEGLRQIYKFAGLPKSVRCI